MSQLVESSYQQIDHAFSQLHQHILSGNAQALTTLFAPDARLFSSHLGEATGAEAIVVKLLDGYGHLQPWLNVTNSHVRIRGDDAAQSAYLSGGMRTPVALFGGHYTVRWSLDDEAWQISELRFVLDYIQAQESPLEIPGWDLAVRPELIVSDFDAPWHVIPDSEPGRSIEEEIIGTYIRYAWGIDQQDIALLASAFTLDATADMVPFGKMGSGREIVGKLKSLRNGQPWMQHSLGRAEVQRIDDGAGTATMHMYRDVPAWDPTPSAEKDNYGAWYSAELRREGEAWKFTSLIYYPQQVQAPSSK
ncbi:nuclear transport factor 2 family protein [Corynebacterium sp. S7]